MRYVFIVSLADFNIVYEYILKSYWRGATIEVLATISHKQSLAHCVVLSKIICPNLCSLCINLIKYMNFRQTVDLIC